MRRRVQELIFACVVAGGLVPAAGFATQVRIFELQSQGAFLAGTLDGVSVDSLGRVSLAARAERLASVGEPFLLSAAALPDGWAVGTGNAGKVLKIDRKGAVSELFTAPEPEVFALFADPDGTLYAGTSPRGKVYRIRGGKGEVFFDPGETYIWALARGSDDALLVATGTEGKLYRVDAAGKGTMAADTEETHLRSLLPLPGGEVLLGTAGDGLILRLSRDGQLRTIYDAQEPEVVAVVPAPDGGFYAAMVSSESSLVDLSRPTAGAAGGPGGAAAGEATVTVTAEGAESSGSRRTGSTGPRSQLLRISRDLAVESLWSFVDDTVYALLPQGNGVLVATGLEGKLYRFEEGQLTLEHDVDERQVVALLPGKPGPAFATTNAAAFYRIASEVGPAGTYTSAALDTGQTSRFGSFRFRGEVPPGASIRFSFRSGFSAEPDRTWSPWSEAREGTEVQLAGVPKGRYVQWRAEFKAAPRGDAPSPRLYAAELSYRQDNLRPKIDLLAALGPGQVLVPSNFNPSNQVYEPVHPNRDGIFTTLPDSTSDDITGGGRTKTLWKKGYQTLRWAASDPNQEPLTYELAFRPAESEGAWRKVAGGLKDDYYSFDATALPDGVYRFRLTASDAQANEPAEAQTAERVSDPVVIDHTPPALAGSERQGGVLRVQVRDAGNPIRQAEVSVNAGEWKPVPAADGLLDGRVETLLVPLAGPGDYVLLRVMDAAWNVTAFDLSREAASR